MNDHAARFAVAAYLLRDRFSPARWAKLSPAQIGEALAEATKSADEFRAMRPKTYEDIAFRLSQTAPKGRENSTKEGYQFMPREVRTARFQVRDRTLREIKSDIDGKSGCKP